jgi:arginine deiminase
MPGLLISPTTPGIIIPPRRRVKMWTVKAEYDKLQVAVLYPGGKECTWYFMGPTGDHPIPSAPSNAFTLEDYKKLNKEFEQFKEIVRSNTSAEVFNLKELLQETLNSCEHDKKRRKKFISTCFPEDWPRIEKLLGNGWMDLTAGEIFGEKNPIIMDGEEFKVGIRPVPKIMRTGDLGHMTSEGFIISRRASWRRSREDGIIRAIVENHPLFTENVHVLLDLKGDAYMEGGDVMCLNENTLAVGIRSNTTKETAIEISKASPEKTVYAVHKYPEELGTGWSLHYGQHLNYIFNMVDEGKALIAPYIFDYPKGSKKTLMKMLETISDDVYMLEPLREESELRYLAKIPEKLKPRIESRVYGGLKKDRVEAFKDVGSVEIYKNGELTSRRDSFIETLIEDGVLDPDGIILVGGDQDDIDYRNEFHHWITALREGGWACSILTLKPGVVIAYHDMVKTNEALEDHGVNVITIKAMRIKQMTETGIGDLIMSLARD